MNVPDDSKRTNEQRSGEPKPVLVLVKLMLDFFGIVRILYLLCISKVLYE